MPFYDYKCQSCGVTFEIKKGINDPEVSIHECCGGTVERVWNAPPHLEFKGHGFYCTDYGTSK